MGNYLGAALWAVVVAIVAYLILLAIASVFLPLAPYVGVLALLIGLLTFLSVAGLIPGRNA